MPEILVALSTWNGARYITSCIDSVLAQDMQDFQLYIIDDASTDTTWDIIEAYTDSRIIKRRNTNRRGLFPNLNTILKDTAIPLVKLLGQDDVLLPECLSVGTAFYRTHPEVGYFYCSNDTINAAGDIIRTPVQDEHTPVILSSAVADHYSLLYGCLSANISNLFLPVNVIKDAGYFSENTITADFDLLVRIQQDHPAGHIADALLHLRDHEQQWSRAPGGIAGYIDTSVRLHRELYDRVVVKHKIMQSEEARQLLIKKAAHHFFDNAIRLLVYGRWHQFIAACRRISTLGPLPLIIMQWTTFSIQKVFNRIIKPGTSG